MLNFSVKAGEYFTIGDDIKVVFLGGTTSNCKVMVEAPRSYNIVRGSVLAKKAVSKEDKDKLKTYYPERRLSPEEIKKLADSQKRKKAAAQ